MPARLHLQHATRWVRHRTWILESRTRLDGQPVFKFCYHPPTRRLWLGYGWMHHAMIYHLRRGRTLDQVVRGIYFRERRIVYLRGHINETWLHQTAAMLTIHGLPASHRVVWGAKAAQRLRHLLENL